MKTIVFLRGTQGSGKSKFIEDNALEPYTLSTDAIRLMYSSPCTSVDGGEVISQKFNKEVFAFLKARMEEKMTRGEFIVVDSTLAKPSSLNTYSELIKRYRYRTVVVEFDVPLEECKRNNLKREKYKQVPDHVIENTYNIIKSNPISKSGVRVISPSEFGDVIKPFEAVDLSSYRSVVVFGDIHGCYEPLNDYFEDYPFSEDTFYIFTGDYLDRGIQNDAVLNFMLSIYDKPNVVCLYGNHEVHLEKYSRRVSELGSVKSDEFVSNTVPQIAEIPTKDIRMFIRSLRFFYYFKYGEQEFYATHSGIPCKPTVYTHGIEFYKGCGNYEDIYDIERNWFLTEPDCVQIHGHRNPLNKVMDTEVRNYNLCDTIEFGGNLRLVVIDRTCIQPKYYKNNVFRPSKNSFITQLKLSPLIKTKELGDGIVSYNFTKSAFFNKAWNDLTTKARGLFIKGEDVVARGYDKFFNLGERADTAIDAICRRVQYPITFYTKYNGFLGLMSVRGDEVRTFSKSSDSSIYANLFRNNLFSEVTEARVREVANEYGLLNHTFIFECVDNENDPHIIVEPKRVVLLDVVVNKLGTEFIDYELLKSVGKSLGVHVKEVISVAHNESELRGIIDELAQSERGDIEGVVAVDATDFMFKLKLPYYKQWRVLRTMLEMLQSEERYTAPNDGLAKDFYTYLTSIEPTELKSFKSIIDARNHYEEWVKNCKT